MEEVKGKGKTTAVLIRTKSIQELIDDALQEYTGKEDAHFDMEKSSNDGFVWYPKDPKATYGIIWARLDNESLEATLVPTKHMLIDLDTQLVLVIFGGMVSVVAVGTYLGILDIIGEGSETWKMLKDSDGYFEGTNQWMKQLKEGTIPESEPTFTNPTLNEFDVSPFEENSITIPGSPSSPLYAVNCMTGHIDVDGLGKLIISMWPSCDHESAMQVAAHILQMAKHELENGRKSVCVMDHLDTRQDFFEERCPDTNDHCVYYFDTQGFTAAIVGMFKDIYETLEVRPSWTHPASMKTYKEQYDAIIAREQKEAKQHE